MTERALYVVKLGCVPYGEALELQRDVASRVIRGSIDGDVLLLLEHPPVVTLGRSSKQGNLVASPEYLATHGVELFEVERGGDVTFHGPGQLVGYPIVDLKAHPHKRDLHWYLRQVEEVLIGALGQVGIEGRRNAGYTGVWVGAAGQGEPIIGPGGPIMGPNATGDQMEQGDGAGAAPRCHRIGGMPARKIASIGVHARDWVTWHGFAINVTTDLSFFDLIVPCGIQDVQMTTVARELEGTLSVSVPDFGDAVVRVWSDVFGVAPESRLRQELFKASIPASQPTAW
ncbi:MAG: lipoyl(octanoyl) transferase LipB [Gemmatimonadaceae bacterium]